MGKLDRFTRLERARPTPAGAPADEALAGPSRFGNIEPPREEPAPAEPDPFAPPPEPEIALEVTHRPDPTIERAKAEKLARAMAELDLAKERVIAEREAREDKRKAFRSPLAQLGTAGKAYLVGGTVLAIALLAHFVGPVAWGLLPVLVGVLLGGMVRG